MNTTRPFYLVAILGLLLPLSVMASEATDQELLSKGLEEKVAAIAGHTLGIRQDGAALPGVSLAEGITEITGVAISPLLGISAVGAWKYWHTAEGARAALPWYCHPWAWGIGLGLITLCLCKDILGAALPGIFKKPLDWIELFENKASAVVASTAFVPLVALAMAEYQRIQPESVALGITAGTGLAFMPLAEVIHASLRTPWITVPLTLALFFIVWVTSHAIHVLIALSPFGIVDTALKLAKLGVLILLTACAAMIHTISPIPALVVCGIIAIVSALLARWSFRLLIFGGVMVSDLLFRRRISNDEVRSQPVRAFLARPQHGIPSRSRGKIEVDATTGQVFFVRRPWLVLPEKRIPLAAEGLVLCQGLLHPSLSRRTSPDGSLERLCYLLPRYRGNEHSLAARMRCAEMQESAILRGFKAVRQWLSKPNSFEASPAAFSEINGR